MRVRKRDGEREAGEAGTGPQVDDLAGATDRDQLERDERVREVHVNGSARIPDGTRGVLIMRQQLGQREQRPGRAGVQSVPAHQRLNRVAGVIGRPCAAAAAAARRPAAHASARACTRAM